MYSSGRPFVLVYWPGRNVQDLTMALPLSINAICQSPWHALKQILQVCCCNSGSDCLRARSAPHNSSKVVHGCISPSFTAFVAKTFLMMGLNETRAVCRPGHQGVTRSQSPGIHHRRGSSVNPGSSLLVNPGSYPVWCKTYDRLSARQYLAVSLKLKPTCALRDRRHKRLSVICKPTARPHSGFKTDALLNLYKRVCIVCMRVCMYA